MSELKTRETDYGPFTNPPLIDDPDFKLPDGDTTKFVSFDGDRVAVRHSSEYSQAVIKFECEAVSFINSGNTTIKLSVSPKETYTYTVPKIRVDDPSEIGVWMMEFEYDTWSTKDGIAKIKLLSNENQRPIKYFKLSALGSLQKYLESKLNHRIYLIGFYGNLSKLNSNELVNNFKPFFEMYPNSIVNNVKGYHPQWLAVIDSESNSLIYETFRQTGVNDVLTSSPFVFNLENKQGVGIFEEYPLMTEYLDDNKNSYTFLTSISTVGGFRTDELKFDEPFEIDPIGSGGEKPNERMTMIMNLSGNGVCTFNRPFDETLL